MADDEAPKPQWFAHQMLSDPKFADVAFQFDKKSVPAHSCILCVRCRVLYQLYEKAQPKKKKERKGTTVLQIPQPYPEYPITPEIFELTLRFLYADNIDFETLDARQVLDLCNCAHVLELSRLVRLCQDRIREALSLENVHSLLKVSHDTGEARVRSFCVAFASKNRKDFISNKPEIGKIGVELFQEVMAEMLEEEKDLSDKEPCPSSTLVSDFKKLHTDVDVGATPGDASVQLKGVDIPFHKCFFAALSKSLSLSFQPTQNGDEQVTEMMKVKPALSTAESFRAILRYLYYGDTSGLTVLVACEVQEFAKTHGMGELQSICEYIMSVTITNESVLSIMKVVFNGGNIRRPELEETRQNTLSYFRENITGLSLSAPELLGNGPIVLAEIILAWQMAEGAKQVGADYCKREQFTSQRRYSEIAVGGEEEVEDEKPESAPSAAPAAIPSSSSHTFITATPSAKNLREEEKKAEVEEEEEKEDDKKDDKKEDKKEEKKGGLFSRKKTNKKEISKEDRKAKKEEDDKKKKEKSKKK